jgi:hypothetical protein
MVWTRPQPAATDKENTVPSNDKEDRKAAIQRANRERRARLALIDAITAVLNTPHDTVEALAFDIKTAMEGGT